MNFNSDYKLFNTIKYNIVNLNRLSGSISDIFEISNALKELKGNTADPFKLLGKHKD